MLNVKFYHCKMCGRVDFVSLDGAGTKSCCNTEMELLAPNTTDAAGEKHLPVIKREGGKVSVTVSSEIHPMTKEHYITFIAVAHGKKVQHYILTPEDKPYAEFDVPEDEKVVAYEYCNLHGLWSTKE